MLRKRIVDSKFTSFREEQLRLLEELRQNKEKMIRLNAGKWAARERIARLEAEIKQLKESGELPKKIWRLENELAELTRKRNALAGELGETRGREHASMQELEEIERENKKALESGRLKKGGR
jgi:chromosome segregation ATPase